MPDPQKRTKTSPPETVPTNNDSSTTSSSASGQKYLLDLIGFDLDGIFEPNVPIYPENNQPF